MNVNFGAVVSPFSSIRAAFFPLYAVFRTSIPNSDWAFVVDVVVDVVVNVVVVVVVDVVVGFVVK